MGEREESCPVALLLIDVINHFEFVDGARTLKEAERVAPAIARLKRRARRAGMPTIYVNDNFGDWRSERSALLEYCLREGSAAAGFVRQLQPDEEDYFVLKPMHSAFYQTPLEVLLRKLGVGTLILAGLATNSCITCTAHDAKMRDLQVLVPGDCSAARTREEHRRALRHLAGMADASTTPSGRLDLSAIKRRARRALPA